MDTKDENCEDHILFSASKELEKISMFKTTLCVTRAVRQGLACNQLIGDYTKINRRVILGLYINIRIIYLNMFNIYVMKAWFSRYNNLVTIPQPRFKGMHVPFAQYFRN